MTENNNNKTESDEKSYLKFEPSDIEKLRAKSINKLIAKYHNIDDIEALKNKILKLSQNMAIRVTVANSSQYKYAEILAVRYYKSAKSTRLRKMGIIKIMITKDEKTITEEYTIDEVRQVCTGTEVREIFSDRPF